MTVKTIDMKIDAAVREAMFTLGLSIESYPYTADMMNNAIRNLVENLIADDTDEDAADPAPVKTYSVQVGHDARKYYHATITGVLAEIMSETSRNGFIGETNGAWKDDGVDVFDNVETVNITDPDTDNVVARYTDGDGWEVGTTLTPQRPTTTTNSP